MDYSQYINKIVKEASVIGRTIVQATKDTADKAKAKIDITRAEVERDKAYASFGRIMYQIEKGILTRDDSIVEAACKRVEEQEEIIKNLKASETTEEAKTPEETEEKAEETACEECCKEEAPEAECCCKEETPEATCCCEEEAPKTDDAE